MRIIKSKKILMIVLMFLITVGLLSGCNSSGSGNQDQYTLTINIEGEGETKPPEGEHKFEKETVVDLEIIPNNNWKFSEWSGIDRKDVTEKNNYQIFMDDNKEITAVFDSITDPIIGETIMKYDEHGGAINKIVLTDNKKILSSSASTSESIRVWEIDSNNDNYTDKTTFTPSSFHAISMDVTSDYSKVLAGGRSSNDTFPIDIIDTQTGEVTTIFDGHSGNVNSIAIFPDENRFASGSDDGFIKIWSIEKKNEISNFSGHNDAIQSIDISSDGSKIVSASSDSTVRIWEVKTGDEITIFTGHNEAVLDVDFSSDDTMVVSGSADGTTVVWDANTGKIIKSFIESDYWIHSVEFSPNDNLVAIGERHAKIWDLKTNEYVALKEHGSTVFSVKFYSDDIILSGSGDGVIKVWRW